MQKQQRKYNLILALGTLIIALVGILQIIKIYGVVFPSYIYFILGALIVFCIVVIIVTLFEKE
jgi:hypothetical protein